MCTNPTSEQMDALLTFLQEHPELARGHLRNVEGRNHSKQLWARLTDELNALGGCIKNTKQWQKVWADKKYLAKKAAAAARRSAMATGGGPSNAPPLTALEERIVCIMGEGYGEPETDSRVPAFPQSPVLQLDPSPVLQLHPTPSTSHYEQLQQELREPIPVQHHGVSNPQRRRRRTRESSVGHERNVRQRLFDMEERRVAAEVQRAQELALIRETLQQLATVIQDGFKNVLDEVKSWRA